MKTTRKTERRIRHRAPWLVLVAALLGLAGCSRHMEIRWQGYLEGEYVYVAAPLAGRLESLAVSRGDRVEMGAELFRLDATVEAAALAEARQRLIQAEAQLQDLEKGQRPSELAATEARLAQARAAAELSAAEKTRVDTLFADRVVSADEHDRARLNHQRNQAQVRELEAQLETARLGGRRDAVAVAEAEVAAASAAVRRAEWSVAEKAPVAPAGGLVFDTLFRAGEQVAAGQPVVVVLPPENLKVRFFVPEAVRATLQSGDSVAVTVSGRDEALPARIVYLSPQAEYTPPVLYNRENRAKLVFMIEAVFAADAGVELLPGQPVDVAPREN